MGQQEYMDDMRARGRAVPVLLSLVIGLTVTCVMIDVLHAVDLGVASHVIGNIFWRCVTMRAWGGRTNEENMKKLEMELNEWYKERKEKSQLQGKLTIARVRTDKGWPKLKAKGAATRHLAEFALVIAKKYLGTSTRERKELAVIQCLVNFYRIISSEGMYLSDEAKRELPKVGNRLCALYGNLARDIFTLGQKFWKMTPPRCIFPNTCASGAFLSSASTLANTGATPTRTSSASSSRWRGHRMCAASRRLVFSSGSCWPSSERAGRDMAFESSLREIHPIPEKKRSISMHKGSRETCVLSYLGFGR